MIIKLPACDFDTGPLNPADTFVDCDKAAQLLLTTPHTLRGLVADLVIAPDAIDRGEPLFRASSLDGIAKLLRVT